MTACGDGGDSGDSAFLGETLELSGQVYIEQWTETGSITYEKFNGNFTINNYGGSGEVKNGKLSYTIGIPTNLETPEYFYFGYEYDDIKASKQDVKGEMINGLVAYGENYFLHKANATISSYSKGYSLTSESVYYAYVDNDVTISGKGITDEYTDDFGKYSYTPEDFSLVLKTGWNAIYRKHTQLTTYTETGINVTSTLTVSLGNPSLKWVLED